MLSWYREFSRLRKHIKTLLGRDRSRHTDNVEDGLRRNPKEVWSYVNGRSGLKEKSRITLIQSERYITAPETIANAFAAHFSSVYRCYPTRDCPDERDISLDCISAVDITVSDVLFAIKKLSRSMSVGPDNIPGP
ncbi:MAG: hypothetical protein PV344_02465, partial [Anaplasma sp.]|nr:hypothetical protein [Anaplasma sp.]